MAVTLTSDPLAVPRRALPAHRRPALTLIEGGRSPRHLAGVHRRRRVVAGLVVVVLALGLVVAGRAALAAVTPQPRPTGAGANAAAGTPSITVRAGDTVWSIARRLQSRGDLRPLVDRLVAQQGSTLLQPGQRVPIPG